MPIDKQRLADLEKRIRGGLKEVEKSGTSEDLVKFYNNNGQECNEYAKLANYADNACHALAAALAALVPDKDAKILDVAAGSGLNGKELRKLGFEHIDALEPAEQYLEFAKSENVYNKYIVESINADKQCSIEDDTYDALILGGSFIKGHVEPNCLPELMRITKKGGAIVFNISENYLNSGDPEYEVHALELKFQYFVDNGSWVKFDAITDAPYFAGERCSIYRIVLT